MKTGLQVLQVALLLGLIVLVSRRNESVAPEDQKAVDPEMRIERSVEEMQVAIGRIEEKLPADLIERLETLSIHVDDVSAQLFEFERTAQRDHMTLQANILKRVSAMSLGGKKATPEDPRALVASLATDGVELNLTNRYVRVKGTLSTPTRPLECVAVNDGGPVHEALLVTNAKPSALREALIAIGAKAGEQNDRQRLLPTGTPLTIYISWAGLKKPWRLQDVITNTRTNDSMKNPKWVFSGSKWASEFRTGNEFYVPDAARVAIALCFKFCDQAVISAANPLCANEMIWMPNSELLPDADEIDVTLTIALQPIPTMERPGVKRESETDR